MPLNVLGFMSAILLFLTPVGAQSPKAPRRDASQVEEIYFVRSVPEPQIAPTDFCAPVKTGFADVMAEQKYSFRSISTNTSDGRVLNADAHTVGSFHGCFGRTANPTTFSAFAELRFGTKKFTGKGECRYVKTDFPERGISAGHCFLDLSAADDQYVGGLLTTNSITSQKGVGPETDPPGYTQASIATVRLWKKRPQR